VDAAAFEALYRGHVGRIHALCLRMAGDPAAADELTQEVFVRAWEQIDGWRREAPFSTWLHRVAVNVLLTDRRATGRRIARVEPVADVDAHGASTSPGAGFDLARALGSLPSSARQVFVLYEVEGLGHEEVAAAMGTSVGTSKSQLHRARDLLRRFLS
jgi:RNA polymerase sigma-70 factor (ECF subfamily)